MNGIRFFIGVLVLCVAAVMPSCNPAPLEVNLQEEAPKLVVSSQIIPGDFMLVTLSRTFSPLKGEEQKDDTSNAFLQSVLVNRARVTIEYNGTSDTLFRVTSGVYMSTQVLLNPYTEIRLNVYDSLNGDQVQAVSFIKPRVSLSSVNIDIEVRASDTLYYLAYSFDDPSEDNWYLTSVLHIDSSRTLAQNNADIFSGESNYIFEKTESDRSFEQVSSRVEKRERLLGVKRGDTLALVFSNISFEYFDFLEARNRSEGLIPIITGEPINYPTNVQGGYGFFNTHNPDIRFFLVP
ncbi:MAG: DUF4249 domain-containing protein [Cytophagaceae bacterium]|jgi:hypothetical protein|nr:DUF4249 domain-containing protein [Cytophagaceae bacterium]